jgi:predicted RND superfamily exporter protein
MSAWLADLLYRWRMPFSALLVAGAIVLAPRANITRVSNDVGAWFSSADQVYRDYDRFRSEFGGTQPLIVALRAEGQAGSAPAADGVFTSERLAFLRRISEDIERVPGVHRIQSLATTPVVRTVRVRTGAGQPPESSLRVEPLLNDPDADPGDVRTAALTEPLLARELLSEDGRTTAVVVTFDESEVHESRRGALDQIHAIVDSQLPAGLRAYYNGSTEISETYNRVTTANYRWFFPTVLVLTLLAMYLLLRSIGRTVVTFFCILVSVAWTLGLYSVMGFGFTILTAMLTPLVVVLAVSDDVHMIQHYDYHRRRSDPEQAFKATVSYLLPPLFGASVTTALGLLALTTSDIVAVREFGIGAAVGVMVDFGISIVLVPTLLGLLRPETRLLPHELFMIDVLRRAAGFAASRPRTVIGVSIVVLMGAAAGIARVRVDTNHIGFFGARHPLSVSAGVIDTELAGVYSFQILLTGPEDSMKRPDTLQRMSRVSSELAEAPEVHKVISLADHVARTNQALHDGDAAAARIPDDPFVVAQELFLFSMTEEGRRELERMVSSDFSRAQITVRLPSMGSHEVYEQIERAERLAATAFAGSDVHAIVTGSGRLYASLDHYLVKSQISSFGTAFLTVFATFFLIFRSIRFGLLALLPNVFPVAVVLGAMGWLGISVNVATVMVASVALGIVDDDTVHFISRFRHQLAAGATVDEAIGLAAVIEGRAALTIALINSSGFLVLVASEYKPSAWFGGLLALTMGVALLTEVFLLPAMIKLLSRFFERASPELAGTAA